MDSHQTQRMQRCFLLPVQQLHALRIWPTAVYRSLFCRLHREICWPGTTGSTISGASHFLLSAFCCWQRVGGKKTVQTTYRKKPSIYSQPKIAANNLMYHSGGQGDWFSYSMTLRHAIWFGFFYSCFCAILKTLHGAFLSKPTENWLHTALFAYVAHKQYTLYSR